MGQLRELCTSGPNPVVNQLMNQFFDSADKLYYDMDKLSYDEFNVREKEMWEIRNKASEIDGDIFLISLYGFDAKAEKLFGPFKWNWNLERTQIKKIY